MSNFLDKTGLSYFWEKVKAYISDKTKSFIPYEQNLTTVYDANDWLTNGYRKTSTATTNLPPECTGSDRWGILFFIAENADDGTGTQMFFPIDGTNKGQVYTRSLTRLNVESPVVGEWKRLITSDEFIPGYMDLAGMASYDGEGYIEGDSSNQYQLCSVTIPGIGSTASELSRQLVRVRFPSNIPNSFYVALKVNDGPYYQVTVYNGTFTTIRSAIPINEMVDGRTVPLSMLYTSTTTSSGTVYQGRWLIDNYVVPYGSNTVRFAWKVTAGGTGAATAEEARENLGAAAIPEYRSVVLSPSEWSNNTQTVTVTGVSSSETSQLIQVMPRLSYIDAYTEAGIICVAQGTNQLTFKCDTVPTQTILVYVVLQDVVP